MRIFNVKFGKVVVFPREMERWKVKTKESQKAHKIPTDVPEISYGGPLIYKSLFLYQGYTKSRLFLQIDTEGISGTEFVYNLTN